MGQRSMSPASGGFGSSIPVANKSRVTPFRYLLIQILLIYLSFTRSRSLALSTAETPSLKSKTRIQIRQGFLNLIRQQRHLRNTKVSPSLSGRLPSECSLPAASLVLTTLTSL